MASDSSQRLARHVRVDGRRSRRPCRSRRPRPPSPRSGSPGPGPSSGGCRPARPAAGRAGWRRTPGPPRPRPPATAASAGRCRGGSGSGCARPSAPCRAASCRRAGPGRRRRSAARSRARTRSARPAGRRPDWAPTSGSMARSRTSSFSPAEHGEDAVRGQLLVRLGEVEVVGELGAGLLLAVAHPGHQPAPGPHRLAQRTDQVGVLGEPLDEDGPGAVQRGGRVGDAPLRVDEGRGGDGRVQAGVGQQARRPAAPDRPPGRSAPWCGAWACTAGRCPPGGPWCRPP